MPKQTLSRSANHRQPESLVGVDGPDFRGQRGEILKLLWPGVEVSSLELSNIALQYQARLAELKKAGYDIRKIRDERVHGRRHCGYRLFPDTKGQQVRTAKPANPALEVPSAIQKGMFAEPICQWADPETSWVRR